MFDCCEQIAAALAERGWIVVENFLDATAVAALRADCLAAWQGGGFREAGVGRGAAHAVRAAIRNDSVMWLDPAALSPAQGTYFARLEQLRLVLNQRLYLGLFEFEGHFAVYPPGHFYRKHLDQFQGQQTRRVSLVLYLNDQWRASDGGALRIYVGGDRDGSEFVDIVPTGGTLAVFLSDRFYHEVMPAQRERLSLTGWFRARA